MIEVKNLCKKYGDHVAVDNLSFTIENGRIYGFLGPNGAGKSTTMNMITGCLAATAGQVLIDGHDIFEDPVEAKRRIGYLPEQPPLYPDMTPLEYLKFVAAAKGIPHNQQAEQVAYVMQVTQLEDVKNRLCRNLSKGYRQRVGIAQAMLGDPDVIILDEPTVGLDPKQIIEIRDLIASLGRSRTVILSSHILSEISAVCQHVMVISHGRMVANAPIEEMSRYLDDSDAMTLLVRGSENKIRMILNDIPEIREYTVIPAAEENKPNLWKIYLTVSRETDIREKLFFAFAEEEQPILASETEQASLERVFLRLTESADAAASAQTAKTDADADPENNNAASDKKADDGDDYQPLFH